MNLQEFAIKYIDMGAFLRGVIVDFWGYDVIIEKNKEEVEKIFPSEQKLKFGPYKSWFVKKNWKIHEFADHDKLAPDYQKYLKSGRK